MVTHRKTCDHDFQTVQCPKLISKSNLESHISECQLRTIKCPNKIRGCIWIGKLNDLKVHEAVCEHKIMEFLNESSEIIEQQDHESYESNESPEEIVQSDDEKESQNSPNKFAAHQDLFTLGSVDLPMDVSLLQPGGDVNKANWMRKMPCGRVMSFEDQRKDHFRLTLLAKYTMMNLDSTVDAHVAPFESRSKLVDRYLEDVTPEETLLAKLEKKRRIDQNMDRREPKEKENTKRKMFKNNIEELKKDKKEEGKYLKSNKVIFVLSQFEFTQFVIYQFEFTQFVIYQFEFTQFVIYQFDSTLPQFELTSPQLELTFHNYTFKQFIPFPFVGNKFLQEIEQQIFETRLKERIRERIMIRLSRKQVQGVIDVSDVLQCLALVVSLGDEKLAQLFVQFAYLMLQSKTQLSQRDMLASLFKVWEDFVDHFLNSEDESMVNLLINALAGLELTNESSSGLNSPVSSVDPSDNSNEHTTKNMQYPITSLADEKLEHPSIEYDPSIKYIQ